MSSVTNYKAISRTASLCEKQLSRIDKQVIHYVHPLAVTILVGIIRILARMAYRFSEFVSCRIIHVICFLLLPSYTSVATTSLLLFRTITAKTSFPVTKLMITERCSSFKWGYPKEAATESQALTISLLIYSSSQCARAYISNHVDTISINYEGDRVDKSCCTRLTALWDWVLLWI